MSKEIDMSGELARLNLRPYMHEGDAELILRNKMEELAKDAKEANKTPKADRTLSTGQRKKMHENATNRSRNKVEELKRRHAAQVEKTQTRPLTLDSTHIHARNGLHGRHYVEVSTPESRRKEPTRIASSEMSAKDVSNVVGARHLRDHIVKLVDTHLTQKDLTLEVKNGNVDAGITRGEVPSHHLRDGVTAFSPLHFNIQGEIITPNNPVTIIARAPRGK